MRNITCVLCVCWRLCRLANLFYSSIDIMPELQLARRKTVTLVSDLVRLTVRLFVCLSLLPSVCLSVCLCKRSVCLYHLWLNVVLPNLLATTPRDAVRVL